MGSMPFSRAYSADTARSVPVQSSVPHVGNLLEVDDSVIEIMGEKKPIELEFS
jgi:hypothetical protein